MAGLIRIVGAILALLVLPTTAEQVTDLKPGPVGAVTEIIDGDTLRIEGVGADIRLIGLQAPKLPLGRKGFAAWPLADESRAALVAMVEGRRVSLRLGENGRDRNGRVLAHIVRDDGLWVQGEMLRQGWARMYTFADNRRLAADMRVLESDARAAKRGIWAHPFYAVRRADDGRLTGDAETFQIIVGKVAAAAKTKDRIFLNFGADFRSDFTASIGKRDWPAFADLDLLALEGAEVEVRGWISLRGGPAIDVTHPEQLAVQRPSAP